MTTFILILIVVLGFLWSALCVCLGTLLELEIEEKENKNEHTCQRKV